uniref:ABC-type lipoprotein export system, ATPase component n=2 Tax=Candidatus Kentrum sp. DK TaxID=2126562 RepID=A0A450STX7_9GAMM|nr:MAG: ABC-type lipoprotein export system, ATPase component [Candidatus Kentron sp. DK]
MCHFERSEKSWNLSFFGVMESFLMTVLFTYRKNKVSGFRSGASKKGRRWERRSQEAALLPRRGILFKIFRVRDSLSVGLTARDPPDGAKDDMDRLRNLPREPTSEDNDVKDGPPIALGDSTGEPERGIELRDVEKIFHHGKPNEFRAIRGINLAIEPRRITVLRGASGSGKTTLLSLIGLLSRPSSGRILLGGRNLSGLPERFATRVRRGTFGFVFQRFHLIPGLSVLENVMLPAYPLGPDYRVLEQKGLALLERFGLADKHRDPVEWLSGGETQRVAICRALINEPAILIADEPTANLDSHASLAFLNIIDELVAEGRTVLLASHDPVICDSERVHRVVGMQDGGLMEG